MYLSDLNIIQIHKLSHQISDFLKINVPIKNMETLVKKLNGKLIYNPKLHPMNDGRIKKVLDINLEENFIIEIPKETKPEDINYKIGKEIGHLFINMGYLIKYDLWNNNNGKYLEKYSGKKDFAAREFASELIMPMDEIRLNLKQFEILPDLYDLNSMAKYFNVDYYTLKYWGLKKGLFSEHNICRKGIKHAKSS